MSARRFCEPTYVPPRPRGRPRKGSHVPGNGHSAGSASAGSETESTPNGAAQGFVAVDSVQPRLLDLRSTAAYLGVSEWTVRDLEAGGLLQRIRIPLPNQGELRKLVFDRMDLDRLIESWKQ